MANDNTCDDGGPRSHFNYCIFGTDCGDCGIRELSPPPIPTAPPPSPNSSNAGRGAWAVVAVSLWLMAFVLLLQKELPIACRGPPPPPPPPPPRVQSCSELSAVGHSERFEVAPPMNGARGDGRIASGGGVTASRSKFTRKPRQYARLGRESLGDADEDATAAARAGMIAAAADQARSSSCHEDGTGAELFELPLGRRSGSGHRG